MTTYYRLGPIENNSLKNHKKCDQEKLVNILKGAIEASEMFIECMRDDTLIHPYFDIDVKWTDENRDHVAWNNESCFNAIAEIFKVSQKELVWTERIHDSKLASFHLIIPKYKVRKDVFCKFMKTLLPSNALLQTWVDQGILDASVYGLGQLSSHLTPKQTNKDPNYMTTFTVNIRVNGKTHQYSNDPEDPDTEPLDEIPEVLLQRTLIQYMHGDEENWTPPQEFQETTPVLPTKVTVKKGTLKNLNKITEKEMDDEDMTSESSEISSGSSTSQRSVNRDEIEDTEAFLGKNYKLNDSQRLKLLFDQVLDPEICEKSLLWLKLRGISKLVALETKDDCCIEAFKKFVQRMPGFSNPDNAITWVEENKTFFDDKKTNTVKKLKEVIKELKMGSAIHYAREQNPEAYERLFPKRVFQFELSKLKNFDIQYANSLPTYAIQKLYVEHFYTLITELDSIIVHEVEDCIINGRVERRGRSVTLDRKIFINSLKPLKVAGILDDKGKPIEFTKRWLDDVKHKSCRSVMFEPMNRIGRSNETTKDYNSFMGFCEDINVNYVDSNDILKPFHKIGLNLCGGNQKDYDFVLDFFGDMIQNPSRKVQVALVFTGDQGCGKNAFIKAICQVLHPSNWISSENPSTFFGEHAEGVPNRLLCNLDEVEIKDTVEHQSAIKALITNEWTSVNPKGVRPYMVRNFARIIFTSNKKNAIKMDVSSGERRFVYFEAGEAMNEPQYNGIWWDKFHSLIELPEFKSALYNFLNNRKITRSLKERPITEAYKRAFKASIPDSINFMRDFIENCKWSEDPIEDNEEAPVLSKITEESNVDFKSHADYNERISIPAQEFQNYFKEWKTENGVDSKYLNNNAQFKSTFTDTKVFPSMSHHKTKAHNEISFIPRIIYEHFDKKGYINGDWNNLPSLEDQTVYSKTLEDDFKVLFADRDDTKEIETCASNIFKTSRANSKICMIDMDD